MEQHKEVYGILNDLVSLPIDQYKKEIEEMKITLINDFKTQRKSYTYTKEFKESPFLKDKEIDIIIDEECYSMTYGNFLSILICFKILNKYVNDGVELDNLEDFLFDPSQNKEFSNYYDLVYNCFIDFSDIKDLIFENISELSNLSEHFVSGTVSLYSLIQLMKHNKDFDDALHFVLDEKTTVPQMIEAIHVNMKIIELVLKDTDNENRNFILSGSGFNMKQVSQVLNLIGPKPDEFGRIEPHPINSNFIKGLSKEDYFVNAKGARKALITNFVQVKESGYLTRKLSMLCIDTFLNEVEKCDTSPENYIKVYIDNETTLKRYENRYFYDPITKELELVGDREDLIGKTISVASPITCSCKSGVCRTCYGNLSKTNKNENIGLIAVLLLTEILTQSLLSTKHLLEAKADDIEWGEKFDKHFNIESNKIFYNGDKIFDIKILEMDDDDDRLVKKIKVGNDVIDLSIDVFLNPELITEYDIEKEYYKLSIDKDDIDDEDSIYVFDYVIKNKELSEPLTKIKNLIDKNEIKERDIDGNVNYLLHLLNEAGISISSEHIEIIIRELLVISDRSEFIKPTKPIYGFMKTSDMVMNGSVTKGLLFEKIKKQFLDTKTYTKKEMDSLFDFLL